MTHPTKPKTTVRRNPSTLRWQVSCACGYGWHTRWHRLALLFAVSHDCAERAA